MIVRLRVLICLLTLCLPLCCSAQLKRSDIIVNFQLRDGQYLAVVNRNGWTQSRTVELCSDEELELLPTDNTLYEEQQSQRAYSLLLMPLSPYLKKGDNIYYTATGKIHFINLDALTDLNGKRLFECYHFFRVSNTKDLPDRTNKKQLPFMVLFGGMDYWALPEDIYYNAWYCHTSDYQYLYEDCVGLSLDDISLGHTEDGTRAGIGTLVNSKDEIKFIYQSRLFFAKPHTGAEASEEIFRSEVRRNGPYIIHLSTHSFNIDFERIPGESDIAYKQKLYKSCGLLFSGAARTLEEETLPYKYNINDGMLYAEEIANLYMSNCDMVVLGACNTALGIVTQDGILGIQSAFKEAGAKTLLMTLWSVNDKATSEFMKQFYTYLAKGKDKHESLELARADLMNSSDFSDPVYWAPFIMLD